MTQVLIAVPHVLNTPRATWQFAGTCKMSSVAVPNIAMFGNTDRTALEEQSPHHYINVHTTYM